MWEFITPTVSGLANLLFPTGAAAKGTPTNWVKWLSPEKETPREPRRRPE